MKLTRDNAATQAQTEGTSGNRGYQAPLLCVAGRANDLIQGPMSYGAYSDTCNSWYTNYAKPNHCG